VGIGGQKKWKVPRRGSPPRWRGKPSVGGGKGGEDEKKDALKRKKKKKSAGDLEARRRGRACSLKSTEQGGGKWPGPPLRSKWRRVERNEGCRGGRGVSKDQVKRGGEWRCAPRQGEKRRWAWEKRCGGQVILVGDAPVFDQTGERVRGLWGGRGNADGEVRRRSVRGGTNKFVRKGKRRKEEKKEKE